MGTRYADSGFHGSKFVSVVVSGAEDNSIVPNAYQASTQAMALTRGEWRQFFLNPWPWSQTLYRFAPLERHLFSSVPLFALRLF